MLNRGKRAEEQWHRMIARWVDQVKKGTKDYNDLVYNAHTMLKDYFSYEDIQHMTLRRVMDLLAEFKPRFREIAKRQHQQQLQQQMEGKRRAMNDKNKNDAWRKMYRQGPGPVRR